MQRQQEPLPIREQTFLNQKTTEDLKDLCDHFFTNSQSAGMQGGEQLYLKNSESKGVSEVFWGLQHSLPVVSIQVNAAEHVQLRVNPVQSAFDQIWNQYKKNDATGEGKDGKKSGKGQSAAVVKVRAEKEGRQRLRQQESGANMSKDE